AVGDDAGALALIRRAARAVPGDGDFGKEHLWFARAGDRLVDEKGWEAGLDAADRGMKGLSAEEGERLAEWRTELFRRWSQWLLDREDVEGSLKVLRRAYALAPADREVHAGVAYHAQEALRTLAEKRGAAAVVEHHRALLKAFPTVDALHEVAW